MKVNACEVSHLFELPELLPYDASEETDFLQCLSHRWEDINDPELLGLIDERVSVRRPMYENDENIEFNDFSLDIDTTETHPIEIGNFAIAYLEDVEFVGIVRNICGESVEIAYYDTQTGENETIEVSMDSVEIILP